MRRSKEIRFIEENGRKTSAGGILRTSPRTIDAEKHARALHRRLDSLGLDRVRLPHCSGKEQLIGGNPRNPSELAVLRISGLIFERAGFYICKFAAARGGSPAPAGRSARAGESCFLSGEAFPTIGRQVKVPRRSTITPRVQVHYTVLKGEDPPLKARRRAPTPPLNLTHPSLDHEYSS